MIIGISGKKRSGKDTVADYLIKRHEFTRYALADPIKHGSKAMFGFNDEQLWGSQKEVVDKHWGVTPREVLQVIGTEIFQTVMPKYVPGLRKINKYFWPHRFLLWYKNNEETLAKRVVIPDIRFPHEVNFLRGLSERTPVFIIKLMRKTGNKDTHASEMSVDNIKDVDAIIDNNSTIRRLHKNVELKVKKFIENASD